MSDILWCMRDDPELSLDVRLDRLAVSLALGDMMASDAVRVALAVLAAGVDSTGATALAGLPVDDKGLRLTDVEDLARTMLDDAGVRLPAPGTAAWGDAAVVAFRMLNATVDPVTGASWLGDLWEKCDGDRSALSEMLQLVDAWEASLGERRLEVEREMLGSADTVLATALKHTRGYRLTP